MNFAINLEDLRNLVQIVFQIIASYVALAGLRSWIIQLRGKTEYEVAKSVIAGAYRIRDEIKRCQSAFMTPGEWAERQPVSGESEAQRQAGESYFAYANRYAKVVEAMNDWYPATIEAEALFGEEARQIINQLKACCNKLRAAIDVYHRHLYRSSYIERTERYFNIINGISLKDVPNRDNPDPEDRIQYDDDNFQEELDTSIEKIRMFFSQYLKARTFTLNPLQWFQNPNRKPDQISGRG